MKMKITYRNYRIDVFKGGLVFIMLFIARTAFTQTITNVFPTRVTTGSTVTVIGVDFDTNPVVSINGIATGNFVYVSPTQLRFEITQNTGGDNSGTLNVGITSYTTQINYIAPKYENLTNDKSFFVQEIYTNWDYDNREFWSSGFYVDAVDKEAASPNNKHELLGYKLQNGIIFSTGVDDTLLETKLLEFVILNSPAQLEDTAVYRRKVFKAYSTNGVNGSTRSDNFIIAGDMIDGIDGALGTETPEDFETLAEISENIRDLTILEAIITGKNGLELGIGVTNFNTQTDVQFFSGSGLPGAVDDHFTPDLLITQIADAQGESAVYYYADDMGGVVGRPILLQMQDNSETELAKWKINLYTFTEGQPFATATPNARATQWIENKFRPLKMVAFELNDFEITTEEQVSLINNINMNAGGQADMAFMAYNAASFDVKGPVAKTILPQFMCRVDGHSPATFKIDVGMGGNVGIEDYAVVGNIRAPSENPEDLETLRYQLWRDGASITEWLTDPSSLTIENVDKDDLGVYKIRIENEQGTVIVPVELVEGGIPYIWNGTSWSFPPAYASNSSSIHQRDISLIFDGNYNSPSDLEGCDCYVAPGKNVTIPEGTKMKLYGAITVSPEVPSFPGETDYIPAATFTLKNNASLIQTKEVAENENSGDIIVERNAKEGSVKEYDYIYWSSPVENSDLSLISGQTSHVYKWRADIGNSKGTTGDWESTSGIMEVGHGYIKRVNDIANNYASFKGVPNNGPYTVNLIKSIGPLPPLENQDMNLLGNPYPSAINALAFLNDNPSLDGNVRLWTHGSSIFDEPGGSDPFYGNFKYNYGDDYILYNGLGPSIPEGFSGNIASGQGFFVKVLDDLANPSPVVFNNQMRYSDPVEEAYDNKEFYRGGELSNIEIQTEKQLIWLSLVNESNMSSIALVGYAEGATNGKDRLYDARSGSGGMRVYSVLEDFDLIIQGRALPFEDSDKVPLGIEIPKNGIYSIGIDHLKGSLMLNADQGIYLEDTYNNVIHNLRSAPYSFTATTGDVKDRFVLRYTNKTLSVDDSKMSETFVYVKNEQLYIKASKNIESVVVYDLTGKKLMDHKQASYNDRFNAPFQFPKGAYLTIIKLENAGSITKKVMN
ncbi:MAG: IPT/TIG domain-containing protein [Gelidibacter sp.]